MRIPGLTKERKAKNDINPVDSSEISKPTTSEEQGMTYICVACGKNFTKPVQLTIQGKGSVGKYDACPYCFSRTSSSDATEKSIDQMLPENHTMDSEETANPVDSVKRNNCGHCVGYLKTLSKDAQFPEECLICPSLIKCKY